MRAFAHDVHTYPLPPGHRFPLAKYRLVRNEAANAALAEVATLRVFARSER